MLPRRLGGRPRGARLGNIRLPVLLGAIGGGAAAAHVPADVLRIVVGSALLLFGADLPRPRRASSVPAPRAEPEVGAAGSIHGARLGSRLPGASRRGIV